jgi:hypothetical protein
MTGLPAFVVVLAAFTALALLAITTAALTHALIVRIDIIRARRRAHRRKGYVL